MRLGSKNNPDFSIIIPTYNRCNFLKKAIASVLIQEDVSFEIIVSDNCSADNTKGVVKGFSDKRIKYFKNKKNIGFPLNIRKCLSKSFGKYIFTLSDDDFILYGNTLSEALKIMKREKVGVGSMGAIHWGRSEKFPCRVFNLSDKLIVVKPKKNRQLNLKVLDINYAFFSGLIFDNSVTLKTKIIENYMYSFYPLIFDTARKYGLVYIPNHFIVARISLRFVPHYYNLEKLGTFFMEDYSFLMKQFLFGEDYQKHKKKAILDSIINLPSIKLFSNNRNYVLTIKEYLKIDKTLLINPKFIALVLVGFFPKIILKRLRDYMIYLAEKETIKLVENYDYFQNLS